MSIQPPPPQQPSWLRRNFPIPSYGKFQEALRDTDERGMIKCPGCATPRYHQNESKYKRCIAKHLSPYACILCENEGVHTIHRYTRIEDCVKHIRTHHFKNMSQRPREGVDYRAFEQEEVDAAAEAYLTRLGQQNAAQGQGNRAAYMIEDANYEGYDEYDPHFDDPQYNDFSQVGHYGGAQGALYYQQPGLPPPEYPPHYPQQNPPSQYPQHYPQQYSQQYLQQYPPHSHRQTRGNRR